MYDDLTCGDTWMPHRYIRWVGLAIIFVHVIYDGPKWPSYLDLVNPTGSFDSLHSCCTIPAFSYYFFMRWGPEKSLYFDPFLLCLSFLFIFFARFGTPPDWDLWDFKAILSSTRITCFSINYCSSYLLYDASV